MRIIQKYRGFTLIEIVIVMAVLGILMLVVIPQFQNVTESAKLRTFQNNCKTVGVALGIYQASHDGELPSSTAALSSYIHGGWAGLEDHPTGAHYSYTGGVFFAEYTDAAGNIYLFTYPD
jgi:prepilin-type N-terminal cleavage/methylation domain-containing protein